MALLKKYYSLAANSLLESVVALSIISICLFIALSVYAAVFSPKTSAVAYAGNNKVNEIFFMQQLGQDMMLPETLSIEEEAGSSCKKITVKNKETGNNTMQKSYYINSNE